MQYQPDICEFTAITTPATMTNAAGDRAAALRARAAILGFFRHVRSEAWPSGGLCQQLAEYAAQFAATGNSVTLLATDLMDAQFAGSCTPLEWVEESLDEFFAATVSDADEALAEAGEAA